ncbi:hypothetical protein SSX86_016284 [Deinandra increscens subsp. villosa]|uniref:FHA domain-containing protein n=1 Tax=Deinandra increscens subsp. villosa TaxID=3103831 RepID=A0AAP0GY84_9ASTR
MVSTRRSGSKSNNNKRSSSSEQKPPSPKRQKGENGGASEKSTPQEPSQPPVVENSKELSSPEAVDLPENAAASCHRKDGSGEGEVKVEAAPAASAVTLIAQVLCNIKLNEREGTSVAVLESKGSKRSVHVNGKTIKKGTSCVLNSGDEIFQQLPNDVLLKAHTSRGADLKMLHIKRRAGDALAVAGASILASLSNLRTDLSRLKVKPIVPTTSKTYLGTEIHHSNNDNDEIDGLEVNSATNTGKDSVSEIGIISKIAPLGSSLDPSIIETGNALETREWNRDSQPASASGMSARSAMLKEEIAGIIDGREVEDIYFVSTLQEAQVSC